MNEYKTTPEYQEWCRVHAWDGFEWFPPEPSDRQKQQRMNNIDAMNEARTRKAEALFEEVMFRLEYGDHPLLIAQEFRFKPRTFARWCHRNGHADVAVLFERGNWDRRDTRAAHARGKEVA